MRDDRTGSEWSHILGTCVAGKLKDTKLKLVPSIITSWKSWRESHPHTTVSVLSRTAPEFNVDMYDQPDGFLVGLRHGGEVVAYPLAELLEHPVINDTVGDEPIVVAYDPKETGAMIFRRTLDDAVIDFDAQDGDFTGGGSRWNRTTGIALDGPHKGKRLLRLSAILSFANAWRRFHPNARIYRHAEP